MKRAGIALWLALFLLGCSGNNTEMNNALELRAKLLAASEVNFHCSVVADYGDLIQTFEMDCSGNDQGDVRFTMRSPESISGITGTISRDRGSFTFDDKVLFYKLLTDDQLSPVSAPWIFLKTLGSGYIRCAGQEGDFLRLTLEDTYEEDALQVDVWLAEEKTPVRGDILYDGKRILSLEIENFEIR